VYFWLKSFTLYEKGFLPNTGGWLHQANKYLSIMTFIDYQIKEHQKDKNGSK